MKYRLSNIILRKEYFGGILFDSDGMFFELNKSGFNTLKSFAVNDGVTIDDDKLSDEFISSCIRKNILTPVDLNTDCCARIIEHLPIMGNYLSFPTDVDINITNRCNQKCIFCYNGRYRDLQREIKDLCTNDTLKIIDECINDGALRLVLLGGEPLAARSSISKIVDHMVNTHLNSMVYLLMTTNGSYGGGIDKSYAEYLSSYPKVNIDISIEGKNQEHHDKIVQLPGAYKKAMMTAENVINAKIPLSVNTVALNELKDDIVDIAKKAKKMGATGYRLQYPMPFYGQNLNDYRNMLIPNVDYYNICNELKSLKDDNFFVLVNTNYLFLLDDEYALPKEKTLLYNAQKCCAGNISVEIMPNGDVYSCPITIENEVYRLGNIFENKLATIWQSEKLQPFRNRDKLELKNNVCKNCDNADVCAGGCRVTASIFNNSVFGGDPRCPKIYAAALTQGGKEAEIV